MRSFEQQTKFDEQQKQLVAQNQLICAGTKTKRTNPPAFFLAGFLAAEALLLDASDMAASSSDGSESDRSSRYKALKRHETVHTSMLLNQTCALLILLICSLSRCCNGLAVCGCHCMCRCLGRWYVVLHRCHVMCWCCVCMHKALSKEVRLMLVLVELGSGN